MWVENGWLAVAVRGNGRPTEGEFRPAEAHLDRLGLSKGGRGILLHLPLHPFSVAVLILPDGTLFLRPPPPRLTLESAQRASGARVHVYVTLRAYMWHGEGLLWRPTLGTGVNRHWPARDLDRLPLFPLVRVRECVNACECMYMRARLSPLATVHVQFACTPYNSFFPR